MSSFSYVALITPKDKTAVAMAICEGTILVGMLLGNVLNGPIIDRTSLPTLTYINSGFALLPLVIVAIFVTDVTSHSTVQYTWRNVIGLSHLLDAFKCVFKKREGNSRLLLNLSFVAYSLTYVGSAGLAANSFFYFVKEKGMTMTEYSVFTGTSSVLEGVTGPGILLLVRRFSKPHRNNISILACASVALGYMFLSLTPIPHIEWLGLLFLSGKLVFYAEIRLLQTKLCNKEELGRMFAYDALIQLLLGAGAAVLIKLLYSATLQIWSGMFLAVFSLLMVFAMVVVTIIDQLQQIDNRKVKISADSESD